MTESQANNMATRLRNEDRKNRFQYRVGLATERFGTVSVNNPLPNEWVIGVANFGREVFRFIRVYN